MAVTCEPAELLALSKCFLCMTPDQIEAVKTYLLAVLAGGSLDRNTLLDEAKCFMCIDKDTQAALQNYLLCQAVNNGA